MAIVVPIERVRSAKTDVMQRDVDTMAKVLQRQGQIEPLQVQLYTGPEMQRWTYETFLQDPWGSEILCAAYDLNWDTVLIVVMERYQP
jgi:hypothetical protein